MCAHGGVRAPAGKIPCVSSTLLEREREGRGVGRRRAGSACVAETSPNKLYFVAREEITREYGVGVALLGSTRIKSTGGGGGFCEAEAFRVEIEEKRCNSKAALHGSMMDAVVYDQLARTAGHSIELLVTTMDKLLPSSRANRQDAIRIATKLIKLERDCITGEGWYILADSVDGAMDGLREMWTLYVPSTEPLPPGNGGAVVPSLPGRETEMFFRNLANEFEQMYVVVQEEIAREYGLGVVVPGGNTVLGSTKSTGEGDGLCQAEAFRMEIEEKRCNSKAALHGSMMDGMVYDQIARTAGDSIDLLVTTMDKLLPTSRANHQDAIRIATKFIKLERDCITGEGFYIIADSVDGAMDGLREMWMLYIPSTKPLPPCNGRAVVPSLPGRETESFFRNLSIEFKMLYSVLQEEIMREYGNI